MGDQSDITGHRQCTQKDQFKQCQRSGTARVILFEALLNVPVFTSDTTLLVKIYIRINLSMFKLSL